MLTQHTLSHFLALWACGAQTLNILLAAQVLANSDEFHFRRNDAATRIVHL